MSEMTLDKVDEIIAYWVSRPVVKRSGKPASVHTCREQIKIFRRFLRWASRAELWQQPNGYAISYTRLRLTENEQQARATAEQVQRYKRDELQTLWEYARPLERLFMVLALNCGFGCREISTLCLSEISTDKIRRVRRKSGVYGEWTLWPETLAALEWYRRQRPASDALQLMLTRNAVPYANRTTNGNRNMAVANAWSRLLNRVNKDDQRFRRLSFNKLRKTAACLMRRAGGGETTATFLCHGKPVKDDPLSEIYSNRVFRRVFRALRRVHRFLGPVFATVVDPFPDRPTQPALSLGTIRRMRAMRQQGFKIMRIADELGISRDTVRRYTRS
jgi:hypothetical protein